MKFPPLPSSALAAFVAAVAFVAAPFAHAQATFDVTVNTTPLIGHVAGPFSLDFQLNNGGVAGNNTAILSQFNFGAGSAIAGTEFYLGGAAGHLSSSVTLTDTSAFNDFSQEFIAGAVLKFHLVLTTNFNAPTPDEFSFAILDSNFANIPTFAPGSSDALITIDITGSHPVVASYGTNFSFSPTAGGPPISLTAPFIVAVPEPSTYGLLGAASLVGIMLWTRRRGVKNQLARVTA